MNDIDLSRHLGMVDREVGLREHLGRPARVVTAHRTYDTTIDDLWDALTNAERIPRWFLPITGELRLGGHYQLEGNAGGEITRCDLQNRNTHIAPRPGRNADPTGHYSAVMERHSHEQN